MVGDIIINGDILDELSKIPNECIDLIFTDCPFNVGKNYGANINDSRPDHEYRQWCSEWIAECFRVLKSTGTFYLMTLPRHLEWKMPIMASHGVFINLISWKNVSARGSKRAFWGDYQPIMVYGKTNEYIFHTYAERQKDQMERWGGWSTQAQGQLKDRWEDIKNVYAGSIHHKEAILKEGTNEKVHPCQMPIGLPRRAIRFSTNPRGIVLDPFAGIGTTAVAALEEGRQFIMIEINTEYCKIAEERVATIKETLNSSLYEGI